MSSILCRWDVEVAENYHKVKPKLKYEEIYQILVSHHLPPLTLRELKEILRTFWMKLLGMSAQPLDFSVDIVKWQRWLVSKDDVRLSLLWVDPDGVERRRSRTVNRRVINQVSWGCSRSRISKRHSEVPIAVSTSYRWNRTQKRVGILWQARINRVTTTQWWICHTLCKCDGCTKRIEIRKWNNVFNPFNLFCW